MTKAAKAPAEKSARAKFPMAHLKPSDLASETNKRSDAIKAHPAYPNTPDAQQVATGMVNSAKALSDILGQKQLLHSQLVSLETQESRAIAACYRANEKAVAVVTDLAQGSEEEINKWGYPVRARTTTAPSNAAPTGLRVTYERKTVMLRLRWNAIRGQRGYLLQIGDGSQAGWGATIHVGEPLYAPQGIAPGQHVSARIAVVRKSGQSDWSDVLSFIAR